MNLFSPFHLFSPTSTERIFRNRTPPVAPPLAQWRDLQALCNGEGAAQGLEFIAQLLRQLAIRVEYDAAELDYLPARGAFVALPNQPRDLLDELVLLHLLATRRPALRVVATTRLQALRSLLAEQLVPPAPPVRPATGPAASGVRQLLTGLHNDLPLLLLPTTDAARHSPLLQPVPPPDWHPAAERLLQRARVPIVPVWLSGPPPASFSWWELLHPLLRPARLPAELLSRRGQTVRVRVGPPVLPAALARLPGPDQLPYLRARLHALGAAGTARLLALPESAVRTEVAAALLEADLAALPAARCLVSYGQWEVYLACPGELPHVLPEIGRLRELVLRRVGEGTQQAAALDDYDAQQHQLFVYDRAARRLVAGYRVGVGRALLRQQGKRGFGLHALFRLGKALHPLLREALELSRFFVREECEGEPLPLALLWKGLAEYIMAHPEYGYLVGLIPVSSPYTALSKAELVAGIRRYCFDEELAQAVQTRKRYRYCAPAGPNAAPDVPRFVAALEALSHSLPAPLRPYVRRSARFIGFSMAPGFSNELSGLLVLDARDLPARAHDLLERCSARAENSWRK